MLKLIYDPVDAGAPTQFGTAIDVLRDDDHNVFQRYPKAQPGFVPAEPALAAAIDAWLGARGNPAEPVVVMVHGFLFDPTTSNDTGPDSPFSLVYGYPPATGYHQSWLPLVGECDQAGGSRAENAVAFAYRSEAGATAFNAAGWNYGYPYAVFDLAPLAARVLASVLEYLGSKPVKLRVLAHSLGTRTFSQSIRLVKARMPANLDRAVLLDGAEFCVDAAANFAGCPFDVFNVTNRTDFVLRAGGGQLCHPIRATGTPGACVIGYDGLGGNERWLDLQLDNPALGTWFTAGNAPDGIPYQINPQAEEESHPFAGLDHWSCYTNDGNRALVHDLLANDVMTGAQLRAHGAPFGTNSKMYGQFNGLPIPPTPQSRADRQRVIAQASLSTTEGVA